MEENTEQKKVNKLGLRATRCNVVEASNAFIHINVAIKVG